MFSQLWFLVENILSLLVSLPQALVAFVRDWLHFRELANRFPGPPTRPIVGNLFDCGLFPDPWTLIKWGLDDVMYRYPAGQIIMGPRMFLLSEVNDIQTLLMNSKNQSRPKLIADALAYCLGKGLVTINGNEWSLHNKIMMPCFHQNLLKTYVPEFNRKSDVFIELLAEYANGDAFDVKSMTETLGVDIIFETLFGLPSNQQRNPDRELFEFILTGQKEISHRIRSPWLYLETIYKISPSGRKAMENLKLGRKFIAKVIEQRKELHRSKAECLLMKGSFKTKKSTLDAPNHDSKSETQVETNKKEYSILVDALMQETGNSLSYESVLDELLTVFLAGFDTTAITLQFALYFLAKNPFVQVTPNSLRLMQYVEMIVKETLRLHPPIFFYQKEVGVDTPLVSCNLVVPAGAIVSISPRTLHMDPKLYPDPHVFDPERFSPENSAKRHPYAFMPFGAGMRTCMALTLIKWVIEDVMVRYPAGQIMMGPLRVFLLSEENDVQTFLMNSKNQSRPKLLDDALTYCLGRGLVTINGEEWSRHHKIITPSFHQNLLKTYVTMFDRKSDVFVEKLSEYANGSAFDVQIMTETLQLDIVFETLLGIPSNQQTTPDHDMLECISIGQKEISHRLRNPLLCIDAIYQLSSSGRKAKECLKWGRNFHNKVLEQRQAILRAKAESLMKKKSLKKDEDTSDTPNIVPTDDPNVNSNKKQFNILIDALLQERGRSISHESVLDENLTHALAGFDTTAIAIQFAFYFLAKSPHVQEKAVRELRDIFDAAGSTEVTAETLQRMQYVDMIVKETLRLHPPVFFYVKEAGVDTPLVSSNLVVPAGAIVLISPRTMHINPKLYPDPHVFDPERFSPENSAKRHPSAFIPFGAGMRACMGRKYAILVLKTVISKVIWNYRILPDETYEPNLHWGITMVTDNGMRIKLLKRSTSR